MRWLYHVLRSEDVGWGSDGRYRPASLETEGFIHASYRDAVAESAALYFPKDAALSVLQIDPRRLDVRVEVVDTPRGPMPHIQGALPADAVRMIGLDDVVLDRVQGTRVGVFAYERMALLDLAAPLEVLSHLITMGFDEQAACEVIALTRAIDDFSVVDVDVWRGEGMALSAARYRPALDLFDVLVLPGGPGARTLAHGVEIVRYLSSFPENRILGAVRTGSLIVEAMGRQNAILSGGGATAGIDLGLRIVRRLVGDDAAKAVAERLLT